MKNLISMTEFVLEQEMTPGLNEQSFINGELLTLEKVRKYANFVKQPLKLEMFVPCDSDENILEETKKPLSPASDQEWDKWTEYIEAKEKVLFEGFEKCERDTNILCVVNDGYHLILNQKETIEDLVNYDITLTKTALKQLGL